MIEITKKLTRRTRFPYSVLFHRPERIVVSLDLGDVLHFRAAGRRRVWSLPIEAAFRYAIRAEVFKKQNEKRAEQAAARAAAKAALKRK